MMPVDKITGNSGAGQVQPVEEGRSKIFDELNQSTVVDMAADYGNTIYALNKELFLPKIKEKTDDLKVIQEWRKAISEADAGKTYKDDDLVRLPQQITLSNGQVSNLVDFVEKMKMTGQFSNYQSGITPAPGELRFGMGGNFGFGVGGGGGGTTTKTNDDGTTTTVEVPESIFSSSYTSCMDDCLKMKDIRTMLTNLDSKVQEVQTDVQQLTKELDNMVQALNSFNTTTEGMMAELNPKALAQW